jgi:hypothetical protein
MIIEVYKVIPILLLEVEIYTLLINLYLDSRVVIFQRRIKDILIQTIIQEAYKIIRKKLQLNIKQSKYTKEQKRAK